MINSKRKYVEFFKVEYFHIEGNWKPKKGWLICVNHVFGQKIFLENNIFLITMKFLFQRYIIIDIVANGQKPGNDKKKIINCFYPN